MTKILCLIIFWCLSSHTDAADAMEKLEENVYSPLNLHFDNSGINTPIPHLNSETAVEVEVLCNNRENLDYKFKNAVRNLVLVEMVFAPTSIALSLLFPNAVRVGTLLVNLAFLAITHTGWVIMECRDNYNSPATSL